ncbi:hypothetical protein LCGC14_3168600, partial [marine sediment metagenome]
MGQGLAGYQQRARGRVRRQFAEARAELEVHETRRGLRDALLDELGLSGQTQRPLEFLLGVDLSDAGVAVGPLVYCRYWLKNETKNAEPFRRWLSNVTRTEVLWPGGLSLAVNLRPLRGDDSPDSHNVGETATLTAPAESFGTAAVTWTTLDAPRAKVDTPGDLFERLDWGRLGPQIEVTRRLIGRMLARTDFEVTGKVTPLWNRVDGYIVDQSPGEPVPKLPMAGYLTTLVHGSARAGRASPRSMPLVAGIRRQVFRQIYLLSHLVSYFPKYCHFSPVQRAIAQPDDIADRFRVSHVPL